MTFIRHGAAALLALVLVGSLTACAPEPEPVQPKKPAAEQAAEAKPKLAKPEPQPEAEAPAAPAPTGFDRKAHSIDDPMSIWVVGNKLRPLNPVEFEPSDLVPTEGVANDNGQPLREVAARATEQLVAGALDAGFDVRVISAYRPYALQVQLYESYIARDGQAAADTYSARPGHSEHQTGLTVDFDDYGACYLASCFGETPAGQWLAENAAAYGFIERYPADKESVTGFMPEPWHFRYVGPELAAEMRATGVTTLEEFFGLPAAPGYAG
ncbi:M15 family metallopeptidase [Leucobacter salsicius]|uniref:M15 family metallopeptidase n=1 Tax=Leucobacter salsicius TaxID=664638 RepID=UPI00034DA662|nr:M15 family metallopeptidase [Leucobacter salsicius]